MNQAQHGQIVSFLTFLIPKLPAPMEDDLSRGILEAIDMDSYREEKMATQHLKLEDEDAEIDPIPTSGRGRKAEPELFKQYSDNKSFQKWLQETMFGVTYQRGEMNNITNLNIEKET